MIGVGDYQLTCDKPAVSFPILVRHLVDDGERTTLQAFPTAGDHSCTVVGKTVNLTGADHVVKAIVTRVEVKVDLVDVTTAKFWTEHRRRDERPGMKFAEFTLVIVPGSDAG